MVDGYASSFYFREQLRKCRLLANKQDRRICREVAMAQARQAGLYETIIFAQALQRPQVVQAQTPALPLIIALGVIVAFMAKK